MQQVWTRPLVVSSLAAGRLAGHRLVPCGRVSRRAQELGSYGCSRECELRRDRCAGSLQPRVALVLLRSSIEAIWHTTPSLASNLHI